MTRKNRIIAMILCVILFASLSIAETNIDRLVEQRITAKGKEKAEACAQIIKHCPDYKTDWMEYVQLFSALTENYESFFIFTIDPFDLNGEWLDRMAESDVPNGLVTAIRSSLSKFSSDGLKGIFPYDMIKADISITESYSIAQLYTAGLIADNIYHDRMLAVELLERAKESALKEGKTELGMSLLSELAGFYVFETEHFTEMDLVQTSNIHRLEYPGLDLITDANIEKVMSIIKRYGELLIENYSVLNRYMLEPANEKKISVLDLCLMGAYYGIIHDDAEIYDECLDTMKTALVLCEVAEGDMTLYRIMSSGLCAAAYGEAGNSYAIEKEIHTNPLLPKSYYRNLELIDALIAKRP